MVWNQSGDCGNHVIGPHSISGTGVPVAVGEGPAVLVAGISVGCVPIGHGGNGQGVYVKKTGGGVGVLLSTVGIVTVGIMDVASHCAGSKGVNVGCTVSVGAGVNVAAATTAATGDANANKARTTPDHTESTRRFFIMNPSTNAAPRRLSPRPS